MVIGHEQSSRRRSSPSRRETGTENVASARGTRHGHEDTETEKEVPGPTLPSQEPQQHYNDVAVEAAQHRLLLDLTPEIQRRWQRPVELCILQVFLLPSLSSLFPLSGFGERRPRRRPPVHRMSACMQNYTPKASHPLLDRRHQPPLLAGMVRCRSSWTCLCACSRLAPRPAGARRRRAPPLAFLFTVFGNHGHA